jgi:hypothetical protein
LRDRHVYIIGLSGNGKTTLLKNMIRQDIEAGKGVAVLDPAGDLAESIVRYIPRERVKDTIYFNPAVLDVPINFLAYENDQEKYLVADDLFVVFKRLTGEGGVRMEPILKRGIQLLLSVQGSVFFDIYRLFTDAGFRSNLISRSTDESAVQFWREVWPKYPHPATEEPLITRMLDFDTKPYLRAATSHTSELNFSNVMRDRKIFIANLATGVIGQDASAVLGALIVSQFQVAAFRRANLPERERTPYYLYIDEFQNFKSSAFNTIITQARKYQLCLTIANQKLRDLDDETRSAVQSVGTTILFALERDDAKRYGDTIGRFSSADLLDLDKFEAIIRSGKASNTTKFRITFPPKAPAGFRDEIIAHTKASYPPIQRPMKAILAKDDDEVGYGDPLPPASNS